MSGQQYCIILFILHIEISKNMICNVFIYFSKDMHSSSRRLASQVRFNFTSGKADLPSKRVRKRVRERERERAGGEGARVNERETTPLIYSVI